MKKDIELYGYPLTVYSDGRIYLNARTTKRKNNMVYLMKGRWMKLEDNGNGYDTVSFYYNNKRKREYVHRLVANVFIPNPKNKPQVNHINGIRNDNRLENLEWVTASENINDMLEKRRPIYSNRKEILQIDNGGSIVGVYGSLVAAGKGVGCSDVNIGYVVNNVWHTAKGFFWIRREEYNEDIHTPEFVLSKFNARKNRYNSFK